MRVLETLVDWADLMEPSLDGADPEAIKGWDEYLPDFLAALREASEVSFTA